MFVHVPQLKTRLTTHLGDKTRIMNVVQTLHAQILQHEVGESIGFVNDGCRQMTLAFSQYNVII